MSPRTTAGLATLLLLSCALAMNYAASGWRAQLDLTRDQRHTLAPVTRRLLAELEGPLQIHAFLPTGVQAPYSTVVRAMRDRLEAYRAVAPDKVRLRVVDANDPELDLAERGRLAEEARGYGIREADLELVRADQKVKQRVWFGVALLYEARQASVPPIERPEHLDHALTSALRQVLRGPEPRVIAFTTGHGEPDVLQSPLAKLLETSAELRALPPRSPVPPDVDALVVLGPQRPFTERERYLIDQHLLRGKALVAFLDYRPRSEIFPKVLVSTATGLEPLLEAYGLRVDQGHTVIDRVNRVEAPAGRDEAGRPIRVRHPLWVRVPQPSAEHPVSRGLPALALPVGAPIEVEARPGLKAQVLLRSAPTSTLRSDLRSNELEALEADREKERPGPATLAVALHGELPSAFAGQPSPPRRDVLDPGARPEAPRIDAAQGPARILLTTSGRRFLAADPNNLTFFRNALEWATADTELIAMRLRGITDPPLDPSSARTRSLVRWGNLLGPPGLLLLFGLVRLRRRAR